MAMSNDMTRLINKVENRLGLRIIEPKLPKELQKDSWADIVKTDTLVTFSRYFPNKVRFLVDDTTCDKRKEADHKTYYYIKEEALGGAKLLGAGDIDWQDTSGDNISIDQTAGMGYYVPNFGGMEDTFTTFASFQNAADLASMYNNNIYVEFFYPNKLWIGRAGNVEVNLKKFVVDLLVEHTTLATISPTKMETFEALAQADIARYLYMNLRYYDGLDTIYVNIDLKLNELQDEAGKRDNIIEDIKNSYVSASNDNIPYIMTVSG